jgi:hypothetical protein
MAKTKMLAKIEADADRLYAECMKVMQHLEAGNKDTEAWIAFAAAQTTETELSASVTAMRNHIGKWDGSTSLKNAFKNKKELAQKRDDAKQKFQHLSNKAKMIQGFFSEVKMEFVSLRPK